MAAFRSLLIDSCIFSILFSRFFIIFTIIILNSFSGSLPVSSSCIWTSVFLIYSFICVVFLCPCIIFFKLTMFEVCFAQASSLNSFLLLVSALLSLVQWFVQVLYRLSFVLSFSLFVFPLMGKAEWGGNPVCWWLGFYFCFVCSLDDASSTGCCWCLGDAQSCIQLVSFVWVLTIWYSLGLVLW